MTDTSTAATSGARQVRRAPTGVRAHAPRPHLGRLTLLILLLIAAALYISPLRAFFEQQDRFEKASAELQAARRDNVALEREVRLLNTEAYIAQRARADTKLVPRDTQVFVIKGLPGRDVERDFGADTPPLESSISVLDRVEDLWRTLLH